MNRILSLLGCRCCCWLTVVGTLFVTAVKVILEGLYAIVHELTLLVYGWWQPMEPACWMRSNKQQPPFPRFVWWFVGFHVKFKHRPPHPPPGFLSPAKLSSVLPSNMPCLWFTSKVHLTLPLSRHESAALPPTAVLYVPASFELLLPAATAEARDDGELGGAVCSLFFLTLLLQLLFLLLLLPLLLLLLLLSFEEARKIIPHLRRRRVRNLTTESCMRKSV